MICPNCGYAITGSDSTWTVWYQEGSAQSRYFYESYPQSHRELPARRLDPEYRDPFPSVDPERFCNRFSRQRAYLVARPAVRAKELIRTRSNL